MGHYLYSFIINNQEEKVKFMGHYLYSFIINNQEEKVSFVTFES